MVSLKLGLGELGGLMGIWTSKLEFELEPVTLGNWEPPTLSFLIGNMDIGVREPN